MAACRRLSRMRVASGQIDFALRSGPPYALHCTRGERHINVRALEKAHTFLEIKKS